MVKIAIQIEALEDELGNRSVEHKSIVNYTIPFGSGVPVVDPEDPPPGPDPDPGYELPDGYGWATMKADKRHAHHVIGMNSADPPGPYPIMYPYPKKTDNAAADRVFLKEGEKVAVLKKKVKADGGSMWFEVDNDCPIIAEQADGRDMPELFFNSADLIKGW